MKKRGVSEVIVAVIMIVIVLVAVGIFWAFANEIIKSNTEDISLVGLTLSMKISNVQVYTAKQNFSFKVGRGPEEGDIPKIEIILRDTAGNVKTLTRDFAKGPLEGISYSVNYDNEGLIDITEISVAPHIMVNGEEKVLDIKDTYIITDEDIILSGTCSGTTTCNQITSICDNYVGCTASKYRCWFASIDTCNHASDCNNEPGCIYNTNTNLCEPKISCGSTGTYLTESDCEDNNCRWIPDACTGQTTQYCSQFLSSGTCPSGCTWTPA